MIEIRAGWDIALVEADDFFKAIAFFSGNSVLAAPAPDPSGDLPF